MKDIYRTIVGAYLISSDGKILFGQKDPNKGGVYDGDCWHIPGGGVDEGETQMQALRREILEEVGIDISEIEPSLLDDKGKGSSEKTVDGEQVMCHMQFNVYRVDLPDPAEDVVVTVDTDFIRYKWFTLEELYQAKLTPPGKELLDRLDLKL